MNRNLPGRAAVAVACTRPFCQDKSTLSPPRVRNPVADPFFQSSARAGASRITWNPSCMIRLWIRHSATPEEKPKFPSIWNGGWRSKRLELM